MRKKKTVNLTYYKRIVLFLLIFSFLIVIPFTALLYNRSEKNVETSINHSNESVLNQIKYNYSYYSETMSALCLSTFFRYDVKELMYNKTVEYNDLYSTIKNLNYNVIQAQPSLQAIMIYNGKSGLLYSTDYNNDIAKQDILTYVDQAGEIPKLKPILRKADMGTDHIEAESYVVSYFMYEYSSPTEGKDSFIVLNQKADWLINILVQSVSDSIPSKIYIANKFGDIYGCQTGSETEREIVTSCVQEKLQNSAEADKGFYIQDTNGIRYLVSYMDLGDGMNQAVMLQDYNEIFANLIKLRNDFMFICLVYVIVGAAALTVISKMIYHPVDELVGYVSRMSGKTEKSSSGNELEHIRELYRENNLRNEELNKKWQSSEKIIEHYLLSSILNDSSESAWEAYYKSMPDAPLTLAEKYRMAVLVAEISSFKENRYGFLEKDEELLLLSAENVLREVFQETFDVETVKNGSRKITVILNTETKEADPQQIKACAEKVISFMNQYFDVVISMASSEIFTDPYHLSQACEEAVNYQKYHLIYGSGNILTKEVCSSNIKNEEITYSRELKRKLEENLKLGKMDQARECLLSIKKGIAELSYENIIMNIMALLTSINQIANEVNKAKNNPAIIHINEIYRRIIEMTSLDEIFLALEGYVESVFSDTYHVREKERDKDRLFVEAVTEYISQNYSDINLSSQSVADYMNMSGRYIMKKFKQCTDLTLNEYILNVRMKQAAYFLTNTDMSVGKIAENIGIENENYFYRLFKKVYGCTPREFTRNTGE